MPITGKPCRFPPRCRASRSLPTGGSRSSSGSADLRSGEHSDQGEQRLSCEDADSWTHPCLCAGGRRASRLGRRAPQPAASTLRRSVSIQELACAATAGIPVVFLVSGGTASWRCRDRRRVGPGTFGTSGSGGGAGRTAWARRAGGRAVVGVSRDHADASCASAKRCTCAWTNSMSSITVVGGASRASTRVFIPIRATGP